MDLHSTSLRFLRSFVSNLRICRWELLLSYFGETVVPCTNCDICSAPIQEDDFSLLARFLFIALELTCIGGITTILRVAFESNDIKLTAAKSRARMLNNKGRNIRRCRAILPLLVDSGYLVRVNKTATMNCRVVSYAIYTLTSIARQFLESPEETTVLMLPSPKDHDLKSWLLSHVDSLATRSPPPPIEVEIETPERGYFLFTIVAHPQYWSSILIAPSTNNNDSPLPCVIEAPGIQSTGVPIQKGDRVVSVDGQLVDKAGSPQTAWSSFTRACSTQRRDMHSITLTRPLVRAYSTLRCHYHIAVHFFSPHEASIPN